ncbi:IclR family transcriptional regulator [Amycolatopsis sp. CA-230715]|uniref:IclR family transcriptional regulator n=1 Tax=Amycolatopsis sp. CA-230715 TaxID=2745196 RepID=UPI001C0383AE|nr:IclR family transcriptional regulator [Amycolatopsis sp. CA-230715]QWF83370.1 HTH-type transcriptional regulator KipR [Amycolatopsis sp. CA-230715]
MTEGEHDENGVRSVLRAIDLLGLFTEDRRAWTVRELTSASGLPKTTVIRLVATCEQRGMLWSGEDGMITVGPGLLRWARLAHTAWDLPGPVLEAMATLSTRCGETVNLYVRSTVHRVCVAQHEGPRTIRHVVPVGDELPLWSGAASKVLLAGAEDEFLRRVSATSPHGEDLVGELSRQARQAGEDGYSVSHGEREIGASSVAAAVRDREGKVVAALALAGPTTRFSGEHLRDFVDATVNAARRVSSIGLAPASSGEGRLA